MRSHAAKYFTFPGNEYIFCYHPDLIGANYLRFIEIILNILVISEQELFLIFLFLQFYILKTSF